MKLSYSPLPANKATQALAKDLVTVIINAGVTYKEAEGALNAAGEILANGTKPIIVQLPDSADS